MRTKPALLLFGALLLAPPTSLVHSQHPRRVMQPFGSDAELLQYLAALDRARPSRQPQVSHACADTTSLAPEGRRVVITGRVRSQGGSGIGNARVSALGRCTTAGTDGTYHLELPSSALRFRSKVRVTADFIGYRRAIRTLAVRSRALSADFTLVGSPVELQELSAADAMAPAAMAKDESITNTQHAGVDEGGIVKLHGDHLVVLRRGRLFTVSVRAGELRPVAMVDAYPAGAEPAEWYDEMLVEGDRVIVIGYSYRRGGTEVSLFAIDRRGGLRHLSTAHLKSNDYYSARNYAARLVDGKLVFYTPLFLGFQDPLASLPAMREWRPGAEGREGGFERIASPRRIYRPARSLEGSEQLTLHTITQCDVSGTRLECDASVVVGPFSRVFYVSPKAVYVWTSEWPYWYGDNDEPPEPSTLFRLPLDGGAPSAMSVAGTPVDQFSFLESEDGHINVVVQPEGTGDWMWTSEYGPSPKGPDSLMLLRAPIGWFDDGRARAPERWYRPLPPPTRGALHNRFAGDHLLYGSGKGWWNNASDDGTLFVVPWRGGEVTSLGLPHSVDRIEVMGEDAVVVGASGSDLHFSGVRLGARPVVAQQFVLESASQGETRSHGFFYRADGARTGILGLPVRGPGRPGWKHLVEGSASVVFLRNEGRQFTRLGALESSTEEPVEDGCEASCVDWYGNARPIFLRGRILALMGYELVEGAVADGGLREVRRASFAPEGARMTVRD